MNRRTFAGLVFAMCFVSDADWAADHVGRTLHHGEMLRGEFVQERQMTGFAKPLRTEGHFVLVSKQGLIWHSEKPFDTTTVITAEALVQIVNGQEAFRLDAQRAPVLSHLYQVMSGALSGDTSALERDFRIEQSGDPLKWQLRLTPKHPDDPTLSQILAITASGTELVELIDIARVGGDEDKLQFLDQTVAPVLLSKDETALFAAAAK